ncbi:hypothetical protein DE146DRAFT_304332 [Phaeosphaeria sp. MPI-PUGE-AT-0046c]|nr:hypothetical protein DE146DRAFT_304332 [Phaeosphaeria sp. MPI-PUGE-AT-0046c]
MSPKIPILGLHLTHATASSHLKTSLTLLSLIAHQIPSIHSLSMPQPDFITRLQRIQARHLTIQTQLSALVKDLVGAHEWVLELADALASMKAKVRQCNHTSRSGLRHVHAQGWKDAARMYWPLVVESYELLRPVLERVRDDISSALVGCADGDIGMKRSRCSVLAWFVGRYAATTPASTVCFAGDVRARWFFVDECARAVRGDGGEMRCKRDHVVPLTSDRKRSAGKYKSRKTRVQAGRYAVGSSSSAGGWIPSTAGVW